MKWSTYVVIMLAICLACSASAVPVQYQIRDMSSIWGRYANPMDINNNGVIAGEAHFGSESHAFYWSESRGMVDLGGQRSVAKAINDSGLIVGYSSVSTIVNGEERVVWHATKWNLDGTATDLGVLPGAVSSTALDINNNGEILGISSFEVLGPYGDVINYTMHVVIWDQNGIIQDLGVLYTGFNWGVSQINKDGNILGFSIGDTGFDHWVRHRDGSYTYLDKLNGDYISADGINDNGFVAGYLEDADNTLLATVWNPDGSVKSRLNPLAGDEFSMAYGINNLGVVVGESNTSDSIHSVLWTPDGTPVSLGSLPGFEISRAQMINDSGWIVGECGAYGDWRTVLWTPVPEPSSLLALIVGLSGVALRWRKRY